MANSKSIKKLKIKNTYLILVIVLISIAGGIFIVLSRASSKVQPPVTYSMWGYENNESSSTQIDINVLSSDPEARYFWSHQYGFTNGGGGYIGMQINGHRINKTPGKLFIFSIWDATDSKDLNGTCQNFGGEGIGRQCIVNFDWKFKTNYRFEVKLLKEDADGNWFRGIVTDIETGRKFNIGDIKAPANSGKISGWTTNWTELFKPVFSCDDVPKAKAIFSNPLHLSERPNRTYTDIANSPCENAGLRTFGNGYIQEQGLDQEYVGKLEISKSGPPDITTHNEFKGESKFSVPLARVCVENRSGQRVSCSKNEKIILDNLNVSDGPFKIIPQLKDGWNVTYEIDGVVPLNENQDSPEIFLFIDGVRKIDLNYQLSS